MEQGICVNPTCPTAANATPVDRYPGPGEYCPDCGELLEPFVEVAPPFAGLSPLEALERLETVGPPSPPPPFRRRSARPYALASAVVVLATGVTGGALHQAAIGQPNGDALRVCRSSISQRLSRDVVSAYRTASGRRIPSVEFGREGRCDVRFSVVSGDDANTAAVVGRDGIVVVVNPQNPMTQLTMQQLRRVLTGEIADWSQLGASPGPIGAVVPEDGSDEAGVLAKQLLFGVPLGRNVRRVTSTADVVALVAGTQGRQLIGIAAFSGAVPAKVISLTPGKPPSVVSIGEGRYPLAVAIGVEAAGAAPPPEATNLVRYARSDVARAIVVQDGLVPSKGY